MTIDEQTQQTLNSVRAAGLRFSEALRIMAESIGGATHRLKMLGWVTHVRGVYRQGQRFCESDDHSEEAFSLNGECPVCGARI